MSQGIPNDINPTTTSGTDLANINNDFKDAIVSGFSGVSRPANLQAGGYWIDLTNDPTSWSMMFYDGTSDIEMFLIDIVAGKASVSAGGSLLELLKASDDTVPPILKFLKQRLGAGQTLIGDTLGEIDFYGTDGSSTERAQARFKMVTTDDTDITELGTYFTIEMAPENSGSLTEVLRIRDGKIGIGETVPDNTIHVKGDGIRSEYNADDAVPAKIILEKRRIAGNGQVLLSDGIGKVESKGADQNGTEFEASSIETLATENNTDLARGNEIVIKTIAIGENTPQERMTIDENGIDVQGEVTAISLNVGTIVTGDVEANNVSDSTDSPKFITNKERIAGSGQVLTNDGVGKIEMHSTDISGNDFESASIEGFATEDQTGAARGSKLRIETITPGTTTKAIRMEIDENVSVTGDMTIDGDLTVNGTTTTINTDTLDVEDANITVNNTGNQATADANDAGITVEMSDATDAAIGYDSTMVSKFGVGEVGSLVEIADISSAQDISNKAIITPSRLDVKQDTEANLITYALTASNGQFCFATDTKIMYQVVDTELTDVGSGGGLGTVDTIFVENFEETVAADLSKGNSAVAGAGGSMAGTLLDDTSTPDSGLNTVVYTQASGSVDDWFIIKTFTVSPKLKKQLSKYKMSVNHSGDSGDIVVGAITDEGDELLGILNTFIDTTGDVRPFEGIVNNIPATASTVSLYIQTKVENIGAILRVDDVEQTLNTHTSDGTIVTQELRLAQGNGHGSGATTTRKFTTTLKDDDNGLFKYATDSTNGMSITALRRITVTGNYSDFEGGGTENFGWTLNSSGLSTSITTLPQAERLSLTNSSSSLSDGCPVSVIMEPGDILRTQTQGQSTSTTLCSVNVVATAVNDSVIVPASITNEYYRADTHAGYGSTDTKIPYYTNLTKNTTGKAVSITNDSTNGTVITAITPSTVVISLSAASTGAGDKIGFSLNSTQLTTDIDLITTADRLLDTNVASNNQIQTVTVSVNMEVGDILRPHTNGATASNASRHILSVTASPVEVQLKAAIPRGFGLGAKIANNGTATITKQSGDWIASVNRTAAGTVQVFTNVDATSLAISMVLEAPTSAGNVMGSITTIVSGSFFVITESNTASNVDHDFHLTAINMDL